MCGLTSQKVGLFCYNCLCCRMKGKKVLPVTMSMSMMITIHPIQRRAFFFAFVLHTFTFTVRRKSKVCLAVCTPDCSLFTCSPDTRVHFILCSPSNSFVFIPFNQYGHFSLIIVNTFPGNQPDSCRIFSDFDLVQEGIKLAVSDKSSSLISLYLSSSSSVRTLFSGHSLLIVLVSHLHTHSASLADGNCCFALSPGRSSLIISWPRHHWQIAYLLPQSYVCYRLAIVINLALTTYCVACYLKIFISLCLNPCKRFVLEVQVMYKYDRFGNAYGRTLGVLQASMSIWCVCVKRGGIQTGLFIFFCCYNDKEATFN